MEGGHGATSGRIDVIFATPPKFTPKISGRFFREIHVCQIEDSAQHHCLQRLQAGWVWPRARYEVYVRKFELLKRIRTRGSRVHQTIFITESGKSRRSRWGLCWNHSPLNSPSRVS